MSFYDKLVNSKNQFKIIIIFIFYYINIYWDKYNIIYLKIYNIYHIILEIIWYLMIINFYNASDKL